MTALLAYYDAEQLLRFTTRRIGPIPLVKLPTGLREYEVAQIQLGAGPPRGGTAEKDRKQLTRESSDISLLP